MHYKNENMSLWLKINRCVKWWLSIVLLLIFTSFVFPQQIVGRKPLLGTQINWNHPLSRGLAGAWLFNEGSGGKIYDLSLNEQDGIFANIAGNPWNITEKGMSVLFDGTDDYISIGDLPDMTDITLSAVVYPVGLSGGHETLIGNWAPSDNGFWWKVNTSNVMLLEAPNNVEYTGTVIINVNEWVHLVVTIDGSNIIFYVNGQLDISLTQSSAISNAGIDTQIGQLPVFSAANRAWDGYVNNVMIFNRSLTAQEVMLLYVNPYAILEQPLYGRRLTGVGSVGGTIIKRRRLIF